MNNAEIYPEWWDTTITIYNKFEDPITHLIKWYKTKQEGAFWKDVGDKITVGNTVLETNNIICRIRKSEKFLEKYLWIRVPNDQMGNYFTIGKGDIIVKGDVADEINEYQTGKRSNDLIAKYKELQGCMTVDIMAIDTGAGRCSEHYRVKGI